jgi:hypothetical protein
VAKRLRYSKAVMERPNAVNVTFRKDEMPRPISTEELIKMSEHQLLVEFLRVLVRPNHELTLADVEDIDAINHAWTVKAMAAEA